MKTAVTFMGVALVPLVLTACQTTGSRGGGFDVQDIQNLAVELDRFDVAIGPAAHNIPIFPLDSWYYVSDKYLFISDGRNGSFLVTFFEPCPEAERAVGLAVSMSGPLLNSGDYIVPISISGSLEGCRIEEINSLLPRSEQGAVGG